MLKKLVFISILFITVFSFGFTASAMQETTESKVNSIVVNLSELPSSVNWKIDGTLQNGVKIVWSKNPGPTYPTREGDKYQYITDGTTSTTLTPFDGEGTYYVRVCEYLGGECATYSNENDGNGVEIFLKKEDTTTSESYYKDIDSSNKLYPYLEKATNKGIYKTQDYFYPENPINRGQFAAVIVRAFSIPYNTAGDLFADLPKEHTFFKEIMTLRNLGVLHGDNGNFKPEENVTRGQALKIIFNTIEALDIYEFEDSDLNLKNMFLDQNINNHTFAPQMKKFINTTKDMEEPVFVGYSDGYFKPDNSITRIQSAKVIVTTLDFSNNLDPNKTEIKQQVNNIKLNGDGNTINWEVDGYSEKGFKVVWSKNPGAEYPLREGDKYHYYSDPSKNSDTLEAFDGEGTYYVRICEYLGGECGVYSNEIALELGQTNQNVQGILLKGEGNTINWTVDGYSEKGFKVVWSKNSGPEYPLREGDKYHYYLDASKNSDTLEAFDGEGTYYVRVCEYLGGACGVYSNEISVSL